MAQKPLRKVRKNNPVYRASKMVLRACELAILELERHCDVENIENIDSGSIEFSFIDNKSGTKISCRSYFHMPIVIK